MKWPDLNTWEGMIDAATRINDGLYPSRASAHPGMMVGCSEPCARCLTLGFVHELPLHTGPRDQCTSPDGFNPFGHHEPCPRKMYDWKPALAAQVSHVSRSVSLGTTDAILMWTRSTLEALSVCASGGIAHAANVYLRDLDESIEWHEMEALGREMLRRKEQQRPQESREKALDTNIRSGA